MFLSPEAIAGIDDILNRLATECVLAAPGRDEGMIPAYSLLGELAQHCEAEPELRAPVAAMQSEIEKLLDAGSPFDKATLAKLRELVEWLPTALNSQGAGKPMTTAETREEPAPTDVIASPDALLTMNLDESREVLTEFHSEAVDHLQQIEAALLSLEQEPDNQEALNSVFRSFHTIKGNAGFLGLVPMHQLAHEVESLLDLARSHQLSLNSAIVTEVLRSRDALHALNQQVAVALQKGKLPTEIVPVSHLIRSVRGLAVVGGPGPRAAAAADPIIPVKKESSPAQAPKAEASSHTIRVNTEKLDSLMDVVGELVIVQSQLVETSRSSGGGVSHFQRNVTQLGRITKELQRTAMALRMIPIKPTFQKMERLARDLAQTCGRKVSFSTVGDDTELDRTMIEEIADPLVHMVRNAVDHGLEPPEERAARGKPECGVVTLSASHQGSTIVIELTDDGRGIDPAKVLAKALSLGLVPANSEPSKEEILQYIFLPGFSTADKVTSLSGRGVGMDVVKRNIDRLRGKVEISSEVGVGSTFKIKLPLTMAIIDGLVVKVGEDRFILPSTSVQMALRPSRESISRVQASGELLDHRGRLLPLHRLYRRLGIPSRAKDPWEGIVLIVEASGRTYALLVDEMVTKQEVVIKNLGAFVRNLPGVSGAAILGDGNIALILDPGTLLQPAESAQN